ncbi:recombinase family protein [Vibrio parahaemolyticus]
MAPYPLGYISVEIEGDTSKKRKILAVNDDEAPIVKEIFSLAEKGIDGKPMGVKAISIYMNNKGVLNRGKRWNRNSVDRVFTRRDYFGEHIHGKNRDPRKGLEPIIVNVPSIISKDQFFNVQDGLKNRGLKNNENKCYRSDSLLVGMLKCSICNSNMVVVSGKGGKYKYYECSKKIRQDVKSCSSKMLPKPIIDNAVRRLLSERVITEENINYIYKDLKYRIRNLVEKSARNVASINRRINDNNSKVNTIIEKVASRELEPNDQINKYITDKRKELESLNRELVTALKGTKLPIKQFGKTQVAQLVKNLKEIVLTGDEARVKQILLILLKEVEITPQKKSQY